MLITADEAKDCSFELTKYHSRRVKRRPKLVGSTPEQVSAGVRLEYARLP